MTLISDQNLALISILSNLLDHFVQYSRIINYYISLEMESTVTAVVLTNCVQKT